MATNIFIDDLPITKDGKLDFQKMSQICQIRISRIEYTVALGKDGLIVQSVNNGSLGDTKLFSERMSKWIRKQEEIKNMEPIHAPFEPNYCPKCRANLGVELIDGCYYKNPYFPKCPECGTTLKKLDWQGELENG